MKKTTFRIKRSTKFRLFFLVITFLCVTQFSFASELFIEGGLDSDNDGLQEFLIWSPLPGDSTLTVVEYTDRGLEPLWAWSYKPKSSARITDVKLVDITGDGRPDIIAISRSIYGSGDKKEPWLMVFPYDDDGFAQTPLALADPIDGTGRTRPTVLDVQQVNDETFLIVGQGTPNRQAISFQLSVAKQGLTVSHVAHYTTPLITSGYGQVFAQGLQYNAQNHIVLFSVEANLLKAAIFNLDNPEPLQHDVLVLNDARTIIGQGITHTADAQQNQTVLLPFKTGEVMSLQWNGSELSLTPTEAFSPFLWPGDAATLSRILANYRLSAKEETKEQPVAVAPYWESAFTDTLKLGDTLTYSIAPDSGASFYSFSWLSPPPEGSTLDLYEQTITWVPERQALGTHLFAFTQENRIGEVVVKVKDEFGFRHQLTPELEKSKTVFSVFVQDTLEIVADYDDSTLFAFEEPRMFSLIVTVPAEMESDRFRFEGVSPFGMLVNESKEIPGTSKKLVGLNIIADLNRVETDSHVTFRYFRNDTSQSSSSTLTIIHDLETNVMYMSVSPLLDTVRQSFHPEAWDPDLYGYPEYFFEGFPASMKMDSSRQSIVFSFDENIKTNILNSSVMMMSPTNPTHWLSLYLDDGALIEIRGEVKVKENLSKKLIIAIDFAGDFFPQMLRTRIAPYGEAPALRTPATLLPLHDVLNRPDKAQVFNAVSGEPAPVEEPENVPETSPADTTTVSEPAPAETDIIEADTLTAAFEDTLFTLPDTTVSPAPADTTHSDGSDQ